MYEILVLIAGAAALVVLFKLAGWSKYKSNAGTIAVAGFIIVATLYMLLAH